MKKRHLPIAVALLLGSSGAYSQWYVGANWFTGEFEDSRGAEFDADAVYARGGYELAEWAAIEGRVGFGTSEDSFTVAGFEAKGEIDYFYGGYFVATYQHDSIFDPYLMVGYTDMEVDGTLGGGESKDDFSYGIGADIEINDAFSLNVEYTSYLDESALDVTGITAGLKISF